MLVSKSGAVKARRIVDFIQEGFANRVTLKTLGTALRGKPEDLGRLFHAVVGVSVHEYVTEVRLEQAAHLVRSGLKIEAVALGVGYRSKKNFYRQFIRRYGLTPETYRRRARASESRNAAGLRGARPHVGGDDATTFGAAFDDTACLIDVEMRPNAFGRPSFVATPFVVLNHGVQPFAVTSQFVEIRGESEADALEGAAVFLEHRFGPRGGRLERQHNHRPPQVLLAPRP